MKYLPIIFLLVFTSFLWAQTAEAHEFGSGTPTDPYLSDIQPAEFILDSSVQ
ncbi:MAG: hypothetical protein SVM86_05650 [Candidatus Cloacimonadota bacterium]|nr:hypothetical protein [Candidatus Cloacimonadota bacterium]